MQLRDLTCSTGTCRMASPVSAIARTMSRSDRTVSRTTIGVRYVALLASALIWVIADIIRSLVQRSPVRPSLARPLTEPVTMAQATAMAKNLSMTTPVAMALTTAMAMALLSLPTLSRPSVGAVAGEAGAGIVPSSAQPSVGAVAGVGAAAGEVGAGRW